MQGEWVEYRGVWPWRSVNRLTLKRNGGHADIRAERRNRRTVWRAAITTGMKRISVFNSLDRAKVWCESGLSKN